MKPQMGVLVEICLWTGFGAERACSLSSFVVNRWPSEIRSTSNAIASTACSIRASRASASDGDDSRSSRAPSRRCATAALAIELIAYETDPKKLNAMTTFAGSSMYEHLRRGIVFDPYGSSQVSVQRRRCLSQRFSRERCPFLPDDPTRDTAGDETDRQPIEKQARDHALVDIDEDSE
jgi:hypothetical protein